MIDCVDEQKRKYYLVLDIKCNLQSKNDQILDISRNLRTRFVLSERELRFMSRTR